MFYFPDLLQPSQPTMHLLLREDPPHLPCLAFQYYRCGRCMLTYDQRRTHKHEVSPPVHKQSPSLVYHHRTSKENCIFYRGGGSPFLHKNHSSQCTHILLEEVPWCCSALHPQRLHPCLYNLR